MNGRWLTERLLATTSLAALTLAALSGEASAACSNVPGGGGGTFTNTGTISCVAVTGVAVSVTNDHGTIGGTASTPTLGAILVQSPGGTVSGGITNTGTVKGRTTGVSLGIGVEGNIGGGITNSGTVSGGDKAIQMFPSAAFAGGITNSGTLQSGHTGILIAAGTFTGGILNSSTGTIIGDAADPQAVIKVTSDVFTGGISNAGNLSMAGFGRGIVIDGSGNATFAGGITNSGTLTAFDHAITVQGLTSFGGGIVNTAGHSIVSQNSSGVFVQGIPNFSGGISNAGTLTGHNDGIKLATIGTFAGNISNSGTITGVKGIELGAVTFAGGGILNSGTIQGSGGTAIDLSAQATGVGITQAGGTILGQILFSSHGDTLSGYGTVVGNITQGNATIAPTLGGNNALKIAGNMTQGASSNTVIEVSPAAAAQLNVTGAASIAGALKIVYDPGTYTNKTYSIVQAGTLTGTYSTTSQSGSVPTGTQSISYTGTDVDLTLAGITTAPTIISTTTGVFGDAANVALSGGFFDVDGIIFDHIDETQFGQGADQVKTALAGTAPMQLAMNGPLQQLAQAGSQMSDTLARHGAWVRGVGSFLDVDDQGAASGFSANSGGVIAGIDHPFGPVALGIGAGYSGTNFKQNDGETGDIQTVRGMLYAHYRAAPQILVDGIAGIAYDRIHTARPITSLGSTATESHNAWEENLALQTGYVMPWQGFTVIPRIGAQYLHLAENRFSETGGSGFNLSRGAQSIDSFQPMISLAALHPFTLGNDMRVTPAFKLTYSHELLSPNETLALTTPTGSIVPASVVTPAHNTVTLGPSVTLRLNDSVNLFADYKLAIGVGKSTDHIIAAGARFTW